MRTKLPVMLAMTLMLVAAAFANSVRAADDSTLPPVAERFAEAEGDEVPDFQKHVSPLFGRLGCNGRSCHGSFQGQGGFRLSLFGYDFQADLVSLTDNDSPRIDVDNPEESLILVKPTDEDMHDGGLRYEKDSWQYHVFHRWIKSGAQFEPDQIQKLVQLEVTPAEIQFSKQGEQVQLRAVAVWEDGTREDVTALCRFQSNSDQVATIDENGLVAADEPGDTHVVVFYDSEVVPIPVIRPVTNLVGKKYPKVATANQVDELVVEKLRKLGVMQSELSADAEFLRRVSLDMTGTLPTADEAEAFISDASPDKRARKIDELLESPAYAAWWTTKLCDFTGNNDFNLRNTIPQMRGNRYGASQNWYDWIHKRVAENTPYDELVTGIAAAVSRNDQSYLDYCETMSKVYRGEEEFAELDSMPYFYARQDIRVPESRAIAFAYSFLGIRIECAQCHKHPFDQWSKQDFEQFTNFFRHVTYTNGAPRGREERKEYEQVVAKLNIGATRGNQLRQEFGRLLAEGKTVPFPELVVTQAPDRRRGDNAEPLTTPLNTARLPGGETLTISEYDDIREPLIDWMRSEDNPYFARAFVNRVWAAYFNVGIVEPPDDMSLANPPSNKPLLDHLAKGFIDSGFDMKWVHREIANSRTYQLSWRPNDTNMNDERNFSRAVPRRLPAEVVYDAVQQATASDAKARAMRSEMDGRAIAIPGASNRNANAGSAYALAVFGKSARESNCDCDRSNESSLLQTVFLQNDSDLLSTLQRNDGWINQVSRSSGDRGGAAEGVQIQRLERRIAQLRRAGDTRASRQAAARLAQLRGRTEVKEEQPENKPADDEAKIESLVKQAYLRSLSRYPDDRELGRSLAYIRESETTANGLRDVLWALINTKEFIVNN